MKNLKIAEAFRWSYTEPDNKLAQCDFAVFVTKHGVFYLSRSWPNSQRSKGQAEICKITERHAIERGLWAGLSAEDINRLLDPENYE